MRPLSILFALLVASSPVAAVDPVNATFFGHLAIEGYDPVAYFTEATPTRGSEEWEHDWQGATWRFSSAEHRDRFAAEPERFAPQYGGYCAWAVSQGSTADVDPEAWRIVDDKLYLNYSREVQEKWAADIPGHIAAADANWPRLLAEE